MEPSNYDPFTGENTTGHEWNGITELNTPVPKIVWFFLLLSTAVAILLWVLLPTWPYGPDYTRGVLKADQHEDVQGRLAQAAALRAGWEGEFAAASFDDIRSDAGRMSFVRAHGARLYSDNCAVCHGVSGEGGEGYPSLVDADWIWGRSPDSIMTTIAHGINAGSDADSRISQMLAFGRQDLVTREERNAVAAYVVTLSGREVRADAETLSAGGELYALQCATCHGDEGLGNTDLGAPNLTDDYWLYGGSLGTIIATIEDGRQGVMPAWSERLSYADRKVLTAFVLDLSEGGSDGE